MFEERPYLPLPNDLERLRVQTNFSTKTIAHWFLDAMAMNEATATDVTSDTSLEHHDDIPDLDDDDDFFLKNCAQNTHG